MDNQELVYTPKRHIPMTAPFISGDGDVMLRFKKPGAPVYEAVSLDDFIRQVYATVEQSNPLVVHVGQHQGNQNRSPPV